MLDELVHDARYLFYLLSGENVKTSCTIKTSNDLVLNVKDGFGNLKAGCRLCGCDPTGSKSDGCDADSGQCECLPGVTGLECNMCKANHYGFSNQGCQGNKINH